MRLSLEDSTLTETSPSNHNSTPWSSTNNPSTKSQSTVVYHGPTLKISFRSVCIQTLVRIIKRIFLFWNLVSGNSTLKTILISLNVHLCIILLTSILSRMPTFRRGYSWCTTRRQHSLFEAWSGHFSRAIRRMHSHQKVHSRWRLWTLGGLGRKWGNWAESDLVVHVGRSQKTGVWVWVWVWVWKHQHTFRKI